MKFCMSTYFFYALSDYGTEKLISDDFLVTWSRDQLLQKAYTKRKERRTRAYSESDWREKKWRPDVSWPREMFVNF